MNSIDSGAGLPARVATAGAVVVAVVAGLAELYTGQDQSAAIMVWFFLCLCSGLVIQMGGISGAAKLAVAVLFPAGAFVAVLIAGAYFYGITRFSAMEWIWSLRTVVRLAALMAITAVFVAVAAQAGPAIRLLLQQVLRLSATNAKRIATSFAGVGTVITSLVLLYKLIVLYHGATSK